MEEEIDAFIRYIAVERGLSENYQVSTRRSLAEFGQWCLRRHSLESARLVTIDHITEYLGDRKRAGLAAASIKLIVVALKIFFRFAAKLRSARSGRFLIAPADRSLSAGDAE